MLCHPFRISGKLLTEPVSYGEKYKSLPPEPGGSLGCGSSPGSRRRGPGRDGGPRLAGAGGGDRGGLRTPLGQGSGILQPGVQAEQAVASVGSLWHPGTHGAQALRGWWGLNSPGFALGQQDSAAALSFVFVTCLNFHPRLFGCSRVAALAFLLRNVDLFGWMLDRRTESCASECSEPTFRNIAKSSCHY